MVGFKATGHARQKWWSQKKSCSRNHFVKIAKNPIFNILQWDQLGLKVNSWNYPIQKEYQDLDK
jgi:hypothetical protein